MITIGNITKCGSIIMGLAVFAVPACYLAIEFHWDGARFSSTSTYDTIGLNIITIVTASIAVVQGMIGCVAGACTPDSEWGNAKDMKVSVLIGSVISFFASVYAILNVFKIIGTSN